MAQIDIRNCDIRIFDGSTHSIYVRVGEGSVSWSEKRQLDAVLSRGQIDTMRLNQDVPLDLSISCIWDFITSSSGEPITVEDALKRRNGAASWVSASTDPLAPYCVNVAIVHTPPCSGVAKETVIFPMSNYIEISHELRDSAFSAKFTCNCVEPQVTRG